jgi:hypothetical protein
MALTNTYDRQALHASSKRAMSANKNDWQQYVHSAGWQALPFRQASTKEEEPIIPAQRIFQSLGDTENSYDANTGLLPSVPQCAAHLELLHAFFALRVNVLRSTALDHTLGIKPEPQTTKVGARTIKVPDDTFATRRKGKWPLFVGFAVVRFRNWVKQANLVLAATESGDNPAAAIQMDALPPLGGSWILINLNRAQNSVLNSHAPQMFSWCGTLSSSTRNIFKNIA